MDHFISDVEIVRRAYEERKALAEVTYSLSV